MGSSQYSRGSEEGEIRPKRALENRAPLGFARRSASTTQRTTHQSATSSTHNNDQQSMAPPPALPRTQNSTRERTLSEEIESSQATSRNKAVPAFPGYVSNTNDRGNVDLVHFNVPPSANTVTASQEQQGITHGHRHDEPELAGPSSNAPQSARRKGKQRALNADEDPYQLQVDEIEDRQKRDDSEYLGPSQDTPTTPYEDVDPEEIVDLADVNAANRTPISGNGTPATILRNIVTAASEDGHPPHSEESAWTCDSCKENADVNTMWNCARCKGVKMCTPCYYDPTTLASSRHSRHTFVEHAEQAGPPVTSLQTAQPGTLQTTEKQQKKTERENYGVRHTTFVKLTPHGQDERNVLIARVRANWFKKLINPPHAFWPDTLAPTSKDGTILQLKNVSSSLLRELLPLSDATKGRIATAHRAMTEAMETRLRLTGDKRKLLADDLKGALALCNTPRRRPRRVVDQSAEQGPSSKRPRHSERIAGQPGSPLMKFLAPTAPLQTAPSPRAEPRASEDLAGSSVHGSIESPAGEPMQGLADASGHDDVEQIHNHAPTPPLSPEILLHVRRRLRDTPVTRSIEVDTDTDWMQNPELKELIYLMCMKADSMGKEKLLVTNILVENVNMAPKIFTEVDGRFVPHSPGNDLPRVTYPTRASDERVVDRGNSLVNGVGRRTGLVIVNPRFPRQKTAVFVASPSEASLSVYSGSDSGSDIIVPTNEQIARGRSGTGKDVGTSSLSSRNAKTRNDMRSDVKVLKASSQHRDSVTAISESNDEESIILDEREDAALALELTSHARYSSGETDILMSDVGAAGHTRSATAKAAAKQQSTTRGNKPSASTPVRHKNIRNVGYLSCGSKEQALRDEVITAIHKKWPRARRFFPAQLAPRSSEVSITEPMEPRDISRPLLLAVHALSSVTLDHHERAFAAMIKAVKKRARKGNREEKLLLVDVEAAVKSCKAAEVYRAATMQMQSPSGSHSSLRSLRPGSSKGTVSERSLSREDYSPVAVSYRSEHAAGEHMFSNATVGSDEAVQAMARLLVDAKALAGDRLTVTINIGLK
ncbi:hypothetical protein LTR35_002223 [Friedmanniomyces endolithicus]|nr:hypothetical protein LTR35_002223 [Friedmanniomyces endolithicus]KAK0299734.1 hypothetical protein LTS00_001503 [Friedmanniomyces endolithicus]